MSMPGGVIKPGTETKWFCHVGAHNGKWVFCRNKLCAQSLNHFLSPDFYIQYSSPKFNNYINFHCILNGTYEAKIAVIISRLHLRLTTKDVLEPAHHLQDQAAIHGLPSSCT